MCAVFAKYYTISLMVEIQFKAQIVQSTKLRESIERRQKENNLLEKNQIVHFCLHFQQLQAEATFAHTLLRFRLLC